MRRLLPAPLRRRLRAWRQARPWGHRNDSYAQEGEDLVIDRLLGYPARGFYVEVGAHHPWRFSNSFRFYRRGWRGLLIDPTPGLAALFARARPGDRFLAEAASDTTGTLSFFCFEEAALNTGDAATAAAQQAAGRRLLERRDMPCRPLSAMLAEALPPGQAIDFLSLDIEGHEAAAIRGNDWQRFRPRLVVVEWHSGRRDLLGPWQPGESLRLLAAAGYQLVAVTASSWFLLAAEAVAATEGLMTQPTGQQGAEPR